MNLSKDERIQFIDYLYHIGIDSIHVVPVISTKCDEYHIINNNELSHVFDEITNYSLNTLNSRRPMILVQCFTMLDHIVKSRECKTHFCSSGINNFAVNYQGDIYPCFMFINEKKEMCMGNIKDFNENNFSEIKNLLLNTTYESVSKCDNCIVKGICTHCLAASWINNNRIDEPLEQLCESQRSILKRLGVSLAKTNKR